MLRYIAFIQKENLSLLSDITYIKILGTFKVFITQKISALVQNLNSNFFFITSEHRYC